METSIAAAYRCSVTIVGKIFDSENGTVHSERTNRFVEVIHLMLPVNLRSKKQLSLVELPSLDCPNLIAMQLWLASWKVKALANTLVCATSHMKM